MHQHLGKHWLLRRFYASAPHKISTHRKVQDNEVARALGQMLPKKWGGGVRGVRSVQSANRVMPGCLILSDMDTTTRGQFIPS